MIRKANTSDIPLLIKFMNKLISHVQAKTNDVYIVNIEEANNECLEAMFDKVINDNDVEILIHEDDNRYTGFIYGRISHPFLPASTIKRTGLIEMCWVEEAYRKTGVARSLTLMIEAWFKDKSVNYVDLHYLLGNSEAEMSWKNLGYKPFRITTRKKL